MSKIFFFYILVFVIGSVSQVQAAKSSKSAKKCSAKNLEYLLEKSAALNEINNREDAQVTKIFMDQNYLKQNLEQVREQIFEIQKDSSNKTTPIISSIESLVDKNPECDRKHLFTSKK